MNKYQNNIYNFINFKVYSTNCKNKKCEVFKYNENDLIIRTNVDSTIKDYTIEIISKLIESSSFNNSSIPKKQLKLSFNLNDKPKILILYPKNKASDPIIINLHIYEQNELNLFDLIYKYPEYIRFNKYNCCPHFLCFTDNINQNLIKINLYLPFALNLYLIKIENLNNDKSESLLTHLNVNDLSHSKDENYYIFDLKTGLYKFDFIIYLNNEEKIYNIKFLYYYSKELNKLEFKDKITINLF